MPPPLVETRDVLAPYLGRSVRCRAIAMRDAYHADGTSTFVTRLECRLGRVWERVSTPRPNSSHIRWPRTTRASWSSSTPPFSGTGRGTRCRSARRLSRASSAKRFFAGEKSGDLVGRAKSLERRVDDRGHVAAVEAHADRIAAWQKANPDLVKKLPD